MSESWISRSLVVVQVSVSSSWRLAHSPNTETMPMIVARTIRMIGTARERGFCALVCSDSPICLVELIRYRALGITRMW